MGDMPPSQPGGDFPTGFQGTRLNPSQSSSQAPYNEHESRQERHNPSAPSPQTGYPPMHAYTSMQHARPENFNMNALGNALPDMSYQGYGNVTAPRYTQGPASPAHLYQFSTGQPYTGAPNISPSSATFNMPYQGQYQQVYGIGQQPSAQHLQSGAAAGVQFYPNQAFVGQQQQPYLVQSSQYNPQSQMYGGILQQYGMRNSVPGDNRLSGQHRGGDYLTTSTTGMGMRSSSIASSSGQSSVVRGPPRKPRQSGHAIWIGNLPPQTDLMSLVLHVCKEAPGLESLFLISKSNCAFANFKDETTCSTAQQKIHDSKFQTVRLVSRLRRSSVVGVGVPTGPAALTSPTNQAPTGSLSPENGETKPAVDVDSSQATDEDTDGNALPKDKFFVVKSLTVEDLELSSADNVYLIFSANKSGEYFGYARMVSPINDDPAAAIEFAPKAQAVEDPELPRAIPTPATDSAPKGRIIDDSARGTIFWEVERDEEDEEGSQSNKSDQEDDFTPPSKAWGKPFKIEWQSTNRLPFYRTRGLRNPWNSNREVKIARDGTELETAIGRRLIGLFHRSPESVQPPPASQVHGVQMPLMGYPPMRPFQ